MKSNQTAEIVINKEPSFHEVWHEGYVEYEGQRYQFWLVDPKSTDENGRDYEIEVRWFFKRIPMELRSMSSSIIEAFKQQNYD